MLASEDEPADLGMYTGEYLRNTNGLRDFMFGQERNDPNYDIWCQNQSQHIAARETHMDTAVMSVRKIAQTVQLEIELEREYSTERAEKLDDRLSKSEKKLAKIAPVTMAKTIQNAMRDCMESMVEQITDQVVGTLEKSSEKEQNKEIQRVKEVEATPEAFDMSDVEFDQGATFSVEGNETVARIGEQMGVEDEHLEASKHVPDIPPGDKKKEFPRFAPSGQVTIATRLVTAPAVPRQKKREVKQLEWKVIPKGTKVGGEKPEVKKPTQGTPAKNPEEMKKDTWAQRAAAPPPPSKKQPEQRKQQSTGQHQEIKGEGIGEVKRPQKKEELKPDFPGRNSMEKRRVTFKRDNG